MANTYIDSFTSSIVESSLADYSALTLTATTQLAWPAYLPPGSGFSTIARVMDIVTPSTAFQLILPIATQASVGQDVLITNRSAVMLVVANYGSASSTSIAAGQSYYFVLSDNTTTAGLWKTIAFGTGTGQADANLLAGNGLTAAVAGKLSETVNIVQFSASGYILADNSRANGYVWNGGQGAITLPVTSSLSSGWFVWIRNNGTGQFTINAPAGARINTFTNILLDIGVSQLVAFDSVTGNFFTFASSSSAGFSFSSSLFDTSSVLVNNLSLVNGASVIQKYVDLGLTRTQNLLVTIPATASLYALLNQTSTNAYTLSFVLSGSAQVPVVVASGTQVLISTDGTTIYVLSTASIGTVQLVDGGVTAPALSWILEPSSGLYRASTYQIGVTVGGATAFTVNGADVNNKVLAAGTMTGIFKAIDGGLV